MANKFIKNMVMGLVKGDSPFKVKTGGGKLAFKYMKETMPNGKKSKGFKLTFSKKI